MLRMCSPLGSGAGAEAASLAVRIMGVSFMGVWWGRWRDGAVKEDKTRARKEERG